MNDKNDLLRLLPKIDRLMAEPEIAAAVPTLGRSAVTDICRSRVTATKSEALSRGIQPDPNAIKTLILADIANARSKMVDRVINGTGVMLHTNLGRAPLGEALFERLQESLSGYCNLEIDILERRRGVRGPGVTMLLNQLCGTEDAVVVNNNAAALFLLLSTFAKDKEVIVSRGELVQIGGGFRIPDILTNAGARLREVGTTNITTISDYRDAVSDETALILKVHQANFSMQGFVRSPSIRDLKAAELGGFPIVSDLGSGNVVRKIGDHPIAEPTPGQMIREGADLVTFSTDKMLGACQGGVIAGKRALVSAVKRHPVMRVVRVDKLTFCILQTVLSHHLAGTPEKIGLWRMAAQTTASLKERVCSFIDAQELDKTRFSPVACESTFGGGSTPGITFPSFGLAIEIDQAPDRTAAFFQRCTPPVVGTVEKNLFIIDFRTVLKADEPLLGASCKSLVQSFSRVR